MLRDAAENILFEVPSVQTDVSEFRRITCHCLICLKRRALIIVFNSLYKPFGAFNIVHGILAFISIFSDEFKVSVYLAYIILPAFFENLFIKPVIIFFDVIESLFEIYIYIRAELEFFFRI